ncbi:MAG TPA: transglutaminase-like domain-containing protein [Tepidisphaeraceae bacterium]|jgi:regulator of sirC expression with transglutaminase-like and TPR domain
MKPAQCCTPAAHALFAKQMPQLETTAGLLRAASLLAMHQQSRPRTDEVERVLGGYAKLVRSRVRGTQQQATLAHLHAYLFDEFGFAGNVDDYYNPANSHLPDVLETKRGLPITLSLVYKVVAEKLGLTVSGVGLPGHFVVSVGTAEGAMIVDCYDSGRTLTPADCRARVEAIFADTVDFSDEMLRPVTHRMWLSRMVQNLLHVHTSAEQWVDVGALLELQMLLWPRQPQLKRDLALVLARIDRPEPASFWLDEYLKTNPDDPEAGELTSLLAKLSR